MKLNNFPVFIFIFVFTLLYVSLHTHTVTYLVSIALSICTRQTDRQMFRQTERTHGQTDRQTDLYMQEAERVKNLACADQIGSTIAGNCVTSLYCFSRTVLSYLTCFQSSLTIFPVLFFILLFFSIFWSSTPTIPAYIGYKGS